MMKHISVTDTTIRQAGKAAGYTLSFREKIELAKLLDRLGVSVIELHAVENPKIDSLLIKSVASAVKESAVCVPVALDPASVSLVWAALREAKHPRIQVPAPVSAVQMEYLAGKKPAAMLEAIRQTVAAARTVCEDVEFLADDATRADPAFLAEALQTAIAAGAAGVTVCDAAGNMLPDAFGSFVRGIYEAVPQTKDVRFGVSCSDALSMADACAVSAIAAGAGEIKAAAYCVDTANLAHMAKLLAAKAQDFGVVSTLQFTQMNRLLSQIAWMCQTGRSQLSPFDNGVQTSSGAVLTVHDTQEAVMKMAAALGYDLSEEDGGEGLRGLLPHRGEEADRGREGARRHHRLRRAAGAADVPARKLRHQHRQHHQRFGADEAHEKRPDALGCEPGRRPGRRGVSGHRIDPRPPLRAG